MSTIGFVGLGAMGSRIASRLLDAGNDVYGTNRTKSRAQPLIEHGLRWRDTPREVAAVVDVIFSMVTDDQALEAVTSGSDGILAGLLAGRYLEPWLGTDLAESTTHLPTLGVPALTYLRRDFEAGWRGEI